MVALPSRSPRLTMPLRRVSDLASGFCLLFVLLFNYCLVGNGSPAQPGHTLLDLHWYPATATWYGSPEGDGSDGNRCFPLPILLVLRLQISSCYLGLNFFFTFHFRLRTLLFPLSECSESILLSRLLSEIQMSVPCCSVINLGN